jgi:hypothetical protein
MGPGRLLSRARPIFPATRPVASRRTLATAVDPAKNPVRTYGGLKDSDRIFSNAFRLHDHGIKGAQVGPVACSAVLVSAQVGMRRDGERRGGELILFCVYWRTRRMCRGARGSLQRVHLRPIFSRPHWSGTRASGCWPPPPVFCIWCRTLAWSTAKLGEQRTSQTPAFVHLSFGLRNRAAGGSSGLTRPRGRQRS